MSQKFPRNASSFGMVSYPFLSLFQVPILYPYPNRKQITGKILMFIHQICVDELLNFNQPIDTTRPSKMALCPPGLEDTTSIFSVLTQCTSNQQTGGIWRIARHPARRKQFPVLDQTLLHEIHRLIRDLRRHLSTATNVSREIIDLLDIPHTQTHTHIYLYIYICTADMYTVQHCYCIRNYTYIILAAYQDLKSIEIVSFDLWASSNLLDPVGGVSNTKAGGESIATSVQSSLDAPSLRY